jgi:hypothetical protein
MSEILKPEISVVILCYRAEQFASVFVGQMEETLKKHNDVAF